MNPGSEETTPAGEAEEQWWIEAQPPTGAAETSPTPDAETHSERHETQPERHEGVHAEPGSSDSAGLMARYSTPGPAMRTMSVLSTPPSPEPAPASGERGVRRFVPEEDVVTIPPTPEAQLRAQIRQRVASENAGTATPAGSLWLLADDPGRGAVGYAEPRSPQVTAVMIVIAVLFVLVLALGFIYMFLLR